MKIIFLGTNGWYTTPTGDTACVLIDSKDHYVVFDAGNGLYKLERYITEEKPISLFISHFHIDHVLGLHTLDKLSSPAGIDVYVGYDRAKDFNTLVAPPYTIGIEKNEKNVSNLNTTVRLHELTEGTHAIPFPVTVFKMFHAFTDHGYRVELDGKVISYSGDTGICNNSAKLAHNADVLIHECSWEVGHPPSPWGHVDPEMAAKIAKEAKVKKLILTHFDASVYTSLQKRKGAEKKAQRIFPNTIAATDDMIVAL